MLTDNRKIFNTLKEKRFPHEDQTEQTTCFLNKLLANEFTLFTKTLNYHWNVTGNTFYSIHTFLEKQYYDLLKIMDEIAERIRILWKRPIGTIEQIQNMKSLPEADESINTSDEMINDLYCSDRQIQQFIYKELQQEDGYKMDKGTEDLLVGILQKHEMMSWVLKSHLY